MAKSKARFLAELLGDSGKVKESKSALEITGGKIKIDEVPTIPNSKLENSSISIAGHNTALGGSVSLNTGDITEHTDYKYYTDARVRAAISASGDLSYNSSTGVISFSATGSPVVSVNTQTGSVVLDTGDISESGNLYFTNARARSAISVSGNALSYNSSTGVITSNFEESPVFTGNMEIRKDDPTLIFYNNSGANTDPNGTISFRETATTPNLEINYNGANDRLEFRGRVGDTNDTDLVYINRSSTTPLTVLGGVDINGNATVSGYLNFDGGDQNGLLRIGGANVIGKSNAWLYIDPNTSFGSGIYINNLIKVDGGKIGSYNEDLQLRTANTTALTLSNTDQTATFAGKVRITNDSNDALVIGSGNESITFGGWDSGASDIAGLLAGSNFGSLITGGTNGHVVVGLRDNDVNDSFSVVSGAGDYMTGTTYDKLAFQVQTDGVTTTGNRLDVKSQGNILQRWYKGSTEMGRAVAVSDVQMAIGTLDSGILFNASSNAVYAWDVGNNSGSDNLLDLGISTRRWKNLHLGGNINVGGTVDGRDVAADGTKLDGIESGATADQTAAEILTAIKTVDGASSGLDADLLDGQHGSYYRNASNINAGTLGSARLPGHMDVGGQIDIGVSNNFGTTTSPDRLWISPHTTGQSDVPGSYHDIINIGMSSSHGIQIASGYGASSGSLYMRTRSDNNSAPAGAGLQAWNKLWHNNNDGSGSGLDADTLDGQHGSYYLDYNNFTNKPTIPSLSGYATESYVDTEVSNLVDSAPGTLNTLNELAAALGDDANFSTTTATSLGNRLRIDVSNQGLSATQKTNALTNLGITATVAELNYTDGVTSNIQTQLNSKLSSFDITTQTDPKYLRSNADDTATGSITITGSGAKALTVGNGSARREIKVNSSQWPEVTFYNASTENVRIGSAQTSSTYNTTEGDFYVYAPSGNRMNLIVPEGGGSFKRSNGAYTIWDSGNDGSGSGLDADLLDGKQGADLFNFGYAYSSNTLTRAVGSGAQWYKVASFTGGVKHITMKVATSGDNTTGTDSFFISAGSYGMKAHIIRMPSSKYNSTKLVEVRTKWVSGANYEIWVKVAAITTSAGTLKVSMNDSGVTSSLSAGTEPTVGSADNTLPITATDRVNYSLQATGKIEAITGFDVNGSAVWHASNDGSGSGLDADTLDGYDSAENGGSKILRSQSNGYLNIGNWINIASTGLYSSTLGHHFHVDSAGYLARSGSSSQSRIVLQTSGPTTRGAVYANSSNQIGFLNNSLNWRLQIPASGDIYWHDGSGGSSNKIWHAGNDGSGSTLDADLLDGQHGSYYRSATNINAGTLSTARLADTVPFGANGGNGTENTFTTDGGQGANNVTHSTFFRDNGQTFGALGVSITHPTNTAYTLQIASSSYSTPNIQARVQNNGTWGSAVTLWSSGNDGSGSTLDADLVDGLHASSFLRSDASDSGAGSAANYLSLGYLHNTKLLIAAGTTSFTDQYNNSPWYGIGRTNVAGYNGSGYNTAQMAFYWGLTLRTAQARIDLSPASNGPITFGNGGTTVFGKITSTGIYQGTSNLVWHAGNDGAGSGLDADTLDGQQGAAYKRNNETGSSAEYGPWYSTGAYVYDSTNGTRYFWNLLGTIASSSCRGTIEYEAKDDENYPNFVRGLITFAGFNNSSFSIQHDQSTQDPFGVQVRVDTSRRVWIRTPGVDWAHYFRFRVHNQSGNFTTNTSWSTGSTRYDTLSTSVPPNSSSDILGGQNLRATTSSVTGSIPSYVNVNNFGGIKARGNIAMDTGASSGKFAVMSSAVHNSYDFYNNGTTYLNGAVIIDDALDLTGGNRALKVGGTTRINSVGDFIGTSYYVGSTNVIDTSTKATFDHLNLGGASGDGGEDVKLGGIRGRFSGEHIQLYRKVGIGFPNGWNGDNASTPDYGIATYGGANLGYNRGTVNITTGSLAVSDAGTRGLVFDGNYTNGQYRHRFRKQDPGAGLPLYIDYAHGTANSFTNIARFGGGGTYKEFSVYGDQEVSGTTTYGPNPTWGKYLKIGGDANHSNANQASIGTTNGNLHIDAATSSATYLNFYDGTGGVSFGSGGTAVVAWMGPDGDLWKGSADNTGSKYWHAGNDGSGTGLDADTLDGQHASAFVTTSTSSLTNYIPKGGSWYGTNFPGSRWNGFSVNGGEIVFARDNPNNGQMSILIDGAYYAGENNGFYSIYSGNNYNNKVGFYGDGSGNAQFSNAGPYFQNNTPYGFIQIGPMNTSHAHIYTDRNSFYYNKTLLYANGNTMWHAGNDGSGSGLDADNLDGSTWSTQTKNVAWRQGTTEAGNNNGIGFWGNTSGAAGSYAIYMSAHNGTYGGRVTGDANNQDYNMYFKMSAGSNRGFVFKNGSTNVFGIDGGGRLQVTGDIYGKAVANQYSNLYRFGGLYLGWDNDNYGVQFNHSITSGFGSTTLSDDITINSYNRIRMNIDTNNNNSNEVFQVGIHTTGSGNTLMTLANNGNFSVTGNVTAYSSDKRLKKNFKKIDNALDKVLSLNGYNFDWRMDKLEGTTFKPDFETNDVGLIAQEVEAVCEQATGPAPFDIQWDENNEHRVSQSGEDYLTVNYDKLVPVLVEAIKEQQETIEEQKNLINRLEERLNKLEENNG